MNSCPAVFLDFRIFAPLFNDSCGKSHCGTIDTSEKKDTVAMTKTIRNFLQSIEKVKLRIGKCKM